MPEKRLRIITVRQLGGIGDCLSLTPVFLGLREKYPTAHIAHVTGGEYLSGAIMDVFTHVPKGLIDEIHTFEPRHATTQRTKEVWAKDFGNTPNIENDLWWKKADLHFDLNTPCVDYEWAAMRSEDGIKVPRYQLWCDAAGVVPSSYKPQYHIRPKERAWAIKYFEDQGIDPSRAIGVGTTACDKRRALGIATLREICRGLTERGLVPIVIDPTFNFPEYAAINGKRVSEIVALVERLSVMVSVDSGLLHVAGTVGTPIVGVFGPTDPDLRMGPYLGSAIDSRHLMPCSPCWYGYQCTRRESTIPLLGCLSKIEPHVIVEEAVRWHQKGRL